MDYEKLHKDTINKLQQTVSCGKITVEVARGICADFIPESEDEKIRKEMIFYFTEEIPQCSIQEHSDKMRVFISWLKRQEVERTKLELKAGNSYFCYKSRWERADSETFKKGLIYKCNKDGVLDNFVIKNPEQHFIEIKDERIAWLEKQGEQRSDCGISEATKQKLKDSLNNALAVETGESWNEFLDEQEPIDKAEPKFKAGDWIVFNGLTLLVNEVVQGYYRTISIGGIRNSYDWDIDNAARLWTIEDANDGDVLNSTRVQATIIFKNFNPDCKHINAYCALQSDIFIHQEMLWDRDFEPSPKIWEYKLFAAMKESGYEWDSEKKELRKIEQKQEWGRAKKVVQWLKIYFKK